MPNSWNIAESYFETCNCDVACPMLPNRIIAKFLHFLIKKALCQ
jgi:hypothetical protein